MSDAALEAMINDDEEHYREWASWWDSLTSEERAREQASMDAYVQEVDDERRREAAWLDRKRTANAERARTGLRKDGTPDRRFKRWFA